MEAKKWGQYMLARHFGRKLAEVLDVDVHSCRVKLRKLRATSRRWTLPRWYPGSVMEGARLADAKEDRDLLRRAQEASEKETRERLSRATWPNK